MRRVLDLSVAPLLVLVSAMRMPGTLSRLSLNLQRQTSVLPEGGTACSPASRAIFPNQTIVEKGNGCRQIVGKGCLLKRSLYRFP